MKRIIACTLIFVLCISLSSCGFINTSSIGTIEGVEISLGEFNYFLSIIKDELLSQAGAVDDESFWETNIDGKKAIEVAKEKAFDETFAFEAKYLKAKENGFEINEERTREGNKAYASLVSQYGGESAFNEYLKEISSDSESIKDIARKSYCISLYLDEYSKEVNSPLNVTDEEIENVKQMWQQQGVLVTRATAKHILISTKDENGQELGADAKEEKRLLAEKLYQDIMSGADFDELMNEYSADPGLAAYPDGYTFGPGEMVEEFEKTAFSLNAGEVSEPVLTTHGYHIIKLVEKTSRDEEEIVSAAKQYLLSEKESSLATQWKSEYKIVKNEEVYNKIK